MLQTGLVICINSDAARLSTRGGTGESEEQNRTGVQMGAKANSGYGNANKFTRFLHEMSQCITAATASDVENSPPCPL